MVVEGVLPSVKVFLPSKETLVHFRSAGVVPQLDVTSSPEATSLGSTATSVVMPTLWSLHTVPEPIDSRTLPLFWPMASLATLAFSLSLKGAHIWQ